MKRRIGLLLLVAFPASAQMRVEVRGVLGEALERSRRGRLSKFIEDEHSRPIAIFSPEARAANTSGDWNGEHAGKWLATASRSAVRVGDARLADRARRIADYLVSTQEPDGYIGTYAPPARFTSDAAYRKARTWDVWVASYTILGLLEAHRQFGDNRYRKAAVALGELCERTIGPRGKSAAWLGNHNGSSGTVLLEPAVELYFATGERHFLDFAKTIVDQEEERPDLRIFSLGLAGKDVGGIADGKIYQLEWNFVGLAKLGRATGDARYLKAAMNAWKSIHDQHLTPGGGPWGGIGRHTETFNEGSFFSPNGYVETCSTMSWIQLNQELLRATGEARFAEEIERSAYNDLLSAQHPNGEDWAYFVFPNGTRTPTYYWACCKSSGALALEEIAGLLYSTRPDGIAINVYAPGRVSVVWQGAPVEITEETEYPFGDRVTLRVRSGVPRTLTLRLRIPEWAAGASLRVNGASAGAVTPGSFAAVAREWRDGDAVELVFPRPARLLTQSHVFKQEGVEVVRSDYAAFAVGPLVYATGLIDGYKRSETVVLPSGDVGNWAKRSSGDRPQLAVTLEGRAPLVFVPAFEAGDWGDAGWRTTWLEVGKRLQP